jgi:hypothetical protein
MPTGSARPNNALNDNSLGNSRYASFFITCPV